LDVLLDFVRQVFERLRRGAASPPEGTHSLAMTASVEGVGAVERDQFRAYVPLDGHYDEVVAPDGSIRPHWQIFANRLRVMPPENQAKRVARLKRLVQENGVADDIYADIRLQTDPWKIDLLPLIVSPAEWKWLERAIAQRARLFNVILRDIYGPQTLLRSGAIPPGLIFSDPAYLRACLGIDPGEVFLDFYAVDLARGPGGTWRVLDNHAETPAGTGFALANRVLHSQVAGDLFRAVNALRLAPFYQKLQTELLNRANRDNPLIALLTPGPRHEDYFSHAYLARYLSLVLMEGGDLRVVGNRVFMKTLEGLKPVDLIVRCVEAINADPLELNPNGFMGPAGLVQAVRRTPRLVSNMLGSAIVENRGLCPYLPALARDLIGEDLLLPGPPRWWLGDAAGRAHVLSNLDRMIIRKAHEGTGRPGRAEAGLIPAAMTPEARSRLIADIELNGAALVAEEPVGFATMPSWTPTGLVPAPFAVRIFAAHVNGSYHVMPGGLAMTVDSDTGVALSASEGRSRDVWVISEKEVPQHISLLRPPVEVAGYQRAGRGLRSRSADNLFWLGRYAERADNSLRLLRTVLNRLREEDAANPAGEAAYKALSTIIAKDVPPDAAAKADMSPKAIEQMARHILSSTERAHGLPMTLEHAHRIASVLRDRLSLDAWNTLQTFQTNPVWRGEALPSSIMEMIDIIDQGIITLAAFNGLIAENMTRHYGWRFLDIGRRLERANALAELFLALFGELRDEETEASALIFLLEAADSIITFRTRYLFAPVLSMVIDLLVLDEANPRSIAFQLAAIDQHLSALPQASQSGVQNEEQRMSLSLLTAVRLAKPATLAHAEGGGARPEFKALFSSLVSELPRLSSVITRRYFNLTEDEQQRVHARSGPRP